jgi:hypothetical protein
MKVVFSALSMLWYRVITLIGWPMPPSEEQKEEYLVYKSESELLALFKSGIPACAILVKDKAK